MTACRRHPAVLQAETLQALTRQLSRTLSVVGDTEEVPASSWKKLFLLLVAITAAILGLVYLPIKEWLVAIFDYVEKQGAQGAALVVALYIPVALLNLRARSWR